MHTNLRLVWSNWTNNTIPWYLSNNVGLIQKHWYFVKLNGLNYTRMPIFGHAFFVHNSTIIRAIVLKFFMEAQETIIYRLVRRNQSYDAHFLFFGPLLVGKWVCPPRVPLLVWGLQNKKVVIFKVVILKVVISKSCFMNFKGWPPPHRP